MLPKEGVDGVFFSVCCFFHVFLESADHASISPVDAAIEVFINS